MPLVPQSPLEAFLREFLPLDLAHVYKPPNLGGLMTIITELIKGHKYNVRIINQKKKYLILSVEGVHPRLYIHFDWIPPALLFNLTRIDLSPSHPESCN